QKKKKIPQTIPSTKNLTPNTEHDFIGSEFGNDNKIQYPGFSRANTPTELNYQYYRNLILNSAYLFKSKGTRRSIEFLLRLVGAPEALIEFNENIYIAGQRINMADFETEYAQISGGTYTYEVPVYESGTTFTILGNPYTGFTTELIQIDAEATLSDYPVDSEGFPMSPEDTEEYFFQKGAGWFELV
ncbi:MAG: hypothetical protein ACK56F_18150, partial [bacterium]